MTYFTWFLAIYYICAQLYTYLFNVLRVFQALQVEHFHHVRQCPQKYLFNRLTSLKCYILYLGVRLHGAVTFFQPIIITPVITTIAVIGDVSLGY